MADIPYPPLPYNKWRYPTDPSDESDDVRSDDARAVFGFHLMKAVRDQALASIPDDADETTREVATEAIRWAIKETLDLTGHTLEIDADHSAQYVLTMNVIGKNEETIETLQLGPAPNGDLLYLGFKYRWWNDRYYEFELDRSKIGAAKQVVSPSKPVPPNESRVSSPTTIPNLSNSKPSPSADTGTKETSPQEPPIPSTPGGRHRQDPQKKGALRENIIFYFFFALGLLLVMVWPFALTEVWSGKLPVWFGNSEFQAMAPDAIWSLFLEYVFLCLGSFFVPYWLIYFYLHLRYQDQDKVVLGDRGVLQGLRYLAFGICSGILVAMEWIVSLRHNLKMTGGDWAFMVILITLSWLFISQGRFQLRSELSQFIMEQGTPRKREK